MTKKEAFFQLIGLFERENIRYALVGNTDEYPDRIGSDVDVMTDAEGMDRFHRAIWTLKEQGLRVVQRFQHEVTSFYYILAFRTDEGGWDFLQPDVCTDYYRHGIKLLDASLLLERRRTVSCPGCPTGAFHALSPADEVVYYLLKKVGKNRLDAVQFDHLVYTFSMSPETSRERIREFWPNSDVVSAALETGDFGRLLSELPSLKEQLTTSGRLPRPARFRDLLRKLVRVCRPTGFVVVLSGLDEAEFRDRSLELNKVLAGAFRRQMAFPRNASLFVLARAKTASSFVLFSGPPCGLARLLVDAEFGPGDQVVDAVLDRLAARFTKRHRSYLTRKNR